MTLAEKVASLHQAVPAIPRLGLAAFRTGTEALHGVSWLGTATVFPQPVGLAASWDTDLVRRVGDAVATEVRAKHAADPTVSLNVWAPVVNPLRNPLWGRNEEGYSEDPELTAEIATAYCSGLRGDHPAFWKTVPTLKHFLAYNNEVDRAVTSSQLRPRVLHEYELPAYRGPVEAGVVGAVMPSYNLVDGRPNHVARELLDELRSWTPASLLVVSDAAAPSNLVEGERYFTSGAESHAAALLAGVDSFTDHDTDSGPTVRDVTAALEAGLLTEDDVDRSVVRLLELRLRTGELDPDLDPYASIPADAIDLPEHRALAREAAAAGVVVLANDGILPLLGPDRAAPRRVAVVGPLAGRVLHDWYSGTPPYLSDLGSALAARLAAPGTSAEGGTEVTEVMVVDGADRIGLRARSTGTYLSVSEPDGTVTASAERCDLTAQLDVTDWGHGVVTLRSAATDALLSGGSWIVRADASRVGGWVAQETFRLHRHTDGAWSVQHIGSGRWLRVQHGSLTLVTDATTLEDAERFDLRTVRSGEAAVAEAAGAADVVVVAVGNDPHILGRETEDRPDLDLPRASQEIWRAAVEANDRAVLAVLSSYPYALGDAAEQAAAVVWSSHAGQELGPGLTDVLVGDVEPTGRLTQTWVASTADAGDILDYDIVSAKSTYWYDETAPLYAFGHGLGYAGASYGRTTSPSSVEVVADGHVAPFEVSVEVTNTGDRPLHELVQVYVSLPDQHPAGRRRRLGGHRRVVLAPGESRRVEVTVDPASLATWDAHHDRWHTAPGTYRMDLGRSSADVRAVVAVEVVGPQAPSLGRGDSVSAVAFDTVRDLDLVPQSPLHGTALGVRRGSRSGEAVYSRMDLDGVTEIRVSAACWSGGPGSSGGRADVSLVLPDGTRPGPHVLSPGTENWTEVVVHVPGSARRLGDLTVRLGGTARIAHLRLVGPRD
ncbi:glycoside hydrolase family 3 C-terminal domain-containing protein [Sanguibacter inulinus]|uniref:Glycoside hydrolase family 3 C-terminal domain-containing protein n=2 Tax=Sanguibacter inulinus TaxID=60922 RepID=A0A853ETR9_9MICO|nr:glycoside hydrolase family 3 C-terminal domain-containing protein [Sanguibacter inulinus]NYS93850.1 glycoside hydrolase family 3 C-terminal domain-containing protein [Sanguibacter inulinus]